MSSHPGPTVVVTTIAVALAIGVGQSPAGIVLVAVTVLTGQLSIGWSNDWLDAARDTASGRSDKPVAAGGVAPEHVKVAAFIALTSTIPLSFFNGVAAGLAHLGLVASGWLYNLGVKGTLASWVPYAVGFGLLPAFVTLGLPNPAWPPWWAMVAGALLGVGAHFANVVADIDDDLATGVRGLPQRIGSRPSGMVAVTVLVAATALLVGAPDGPPSAGMWLCLAAVALTASWAARALIRSGDSSHLFHAALLIALVDVVLLVSTAEIVVS